MGYSRSVSHVQFSKEGSRQSGGGAGRSLALPSGQVTVHLSVEPAHAVEHSVTSEELGEGAGAEAVDTQ